MKFSKLALTAAVAMSAAAAQAAAPANLVTNGSFESTVLNNGAWLVTSNIDGWTGPIELRNSVEGIAQDGSNFAELDVVTNSTITQTIYGTGMVNLSFWYSARPSTAAGTNDLGFSLGSLSGTVLTGEGNASSLHGWQQFAGIADLGTSGSAVLSFAALGASDSVGGSLDNVSVTAVPEPEAVAMLLAGLGLVAGIARRRNRK